MPNGILIVNKPAGWTSQDVAAKLRGVFREKRVGHGGTLDPMATGVLPIFIGRATRAVPYFEHADKEYEAVLRLGLVTDTQDVTGRTLEEHPVDITPEQLEAVLPRFRGEILQVPPMYSAVKVGGQKLYQLARKGKEIERPARPVTIHELAVVQATGSRQEAAVAGDRGSGIRGQASGIRHQASDPPVGGGALDAPFPAPTRDQASGIRDQRHRELFPVSPVTYRLRVRCSKGTYVRTLCHDVGQALGCGGCMAALTRTRAGAYTLAEAHTMEEILAAPDPEALLLPIDSLFSDRPALTVSESAERGLRNGAAVPAPGKPDGEYRVYSGSGEFLLLGRIADGTLRTVRSFFSVSG